MEISTGILVLFLVTDTARPESTWLRREVSRSTRWVRCAEWNEDRLFTRNRRLCLYSRVWVLTTSGYIDKSLKHWLETGMLWVVVGQFFKHLRKKAFHKWGFALFADRSLRFSDFLSLLSRSRGPPSFIFLLFGVRIGTHFALVTGCLWNRVVGVRSFPLNMIRGYVRGVV